MEEEFQEFLKDGKTISALREWFFSMALPRQRLITHGLTTNHTRSHEWLIDGLLGSRLLFLEQKIKKSDIPGNCV